MKIHILGICGTFMGGLALLARESGVEVEGSDANVYPPMSTQLEAQGCDIGNELWSASLLQSNPDAIVTATRAYLDAGAECVATATYQASREGFATRGLSAEQSDELMLLSVDLATRARTEFLQENLDIEFEPQIAASIGPYGAMLHDGSEYSGNYGVTAETLRRFHQSRLELLDGSTADVLAIETIPSRLEAEVLVDLLGECETPAWISFSCRDGAHVVDGSPLEEVALLYADHPTVVAVGINMGIASLSCATIELPLHIAAHQLLY